MGKRTPVQEQPYNPLDPQLARSVIVGGESAQRMTVDVSPPTPLHHAEIPSAEQGVNAPSPHRNEKAAQRRGREKRVVLLFHEERLIERLTDRIADELKTSLKFSHLLRATVTVLLHAEEEILRRVQNAGPLDRPSNWDSLALARFEHDLAKLLCLALRDAPPLR